MIFSRRLFSAAASGGPTTIAASIAASFRQRSLHKSFTRTQILDGNQLHKLILTLNRKHLHPSSANGQVPAHGTPVPPGYHLVYFTPDGVESELGLDGSDKGFNPDSPFTRRMWAGGKIDWTKGNVLRIGQTVKETTELRSADAKVGKVGGEMIVVGVKKTFENEHGVAVEDYRNWVFMKERPPIANLEPPPLLQSPSSPLPDDVKAAATLTRHFQQSDQMLFRFSALTFNCHKIHYSHPWCREVEGFASVVVHGPLNLINLLDMWRDVHAHDIGRDGTPAQIQYKAVNPVLCGEEYTAVVEMGEGGEAVGTMKKGNGKVVMNATIR